MTPLRGKRCVCVAVRGGACMPRPRSAQRVARIERSAKSGSRAIFDANPDFVSLNPGYDNALVPSIAVARRGDDARESSLVRRRHHVDARDPGNARQLLDQLDADALALCRRIGRALEPLHERVGNDRAVEVLLHPARRLGRAQRCDADDQEEVSAVPHVSLSRAA